MDEREVRSKSTALQKAIAANEPKENIINILKDLQKNVKPTKELLRATAIGRVVNRIKGMNNLGPECQRLASDVVRGWRDVVNPDKDASGTSTPVTNGAKSNGTKSNTARADHAKSSPNLDARSNGTQSPVPQSKSSSKSANTDKKRNSKTDKVPRDKLTDDDARNRAIIGFYDVLCIDSTEEMPKILDVAMKVEKALLALDPKTYKTDFSKLWTNLKNPSNPGLRTRVLTGKISPDRFVTMSHKELRSPDLIEEENRLKKENMDKAMVAQEEKSVSTHLECGKCREKKVSYTQAQTRSADEPMTTFCECLVCGNRWKFS